MKLYIVQRTDGIWYDQCEAMIVVAESAEASARVQPYPDIRDCQGCWEDDPAKLEVREIGEASPGIRAGVVMTSHVEFGGGRPPRWIAQLFGE